MAFWLRGTLGPKMAVNKYELSICSYNCRSLKKSDTIVYELCNKYDILLLQEHWLYPHDLSMLNCFHDDFYGIGMSAIDATSNSSQKEA